MAIHKVLIGGQWRDSNATGTFQADDPRTATKIDDEYPVSDWTDCDAALDSAANAFDILKKTPREQIAVFLEKFADRIEQRSGEICERASRETALPVEPRLASGELPRTTGQLRLAAAAAKSASWRMPVIDTQTNIRSCLAPLGPVAVFGPNNFPLAFGSISGGDFAAAIAAGNPVIAKANSMHPGTTRLLAEAAQIAADEAALPPGTVQMIYRLAHIDGEKLVADPRLGAVGYTGSRAPGLILKTAADRVGKPIYLELSSINPVVIFPHALGERGEEIAAELSDSCLMGTGQFCTSPGLIIVPNGDRAKQFVADLAKNFGAAPIGTLLSKSGQTGLASAVKTLLAAGAELICGGTSGGGKGYSHANTMLAIDGSRFLENSAALQTEAFGNSTLVVYVESLDQASQVVCSLDGNLTGSIYSASKGGDDTAYDLIAPLLRHRVGRLLNDKMPTGVAVSPAMNHGGPFPATGHPGFTAVGIPASLARFAMLQCFDNVRSHRLPDILQDENPGNLWRQIDGTWTQASFNEMAEAKLASTV